MQLLLAQRPCARSIVRTHPRFQEGAGEVELVCVEVLGGRKRDTPARGATLTWGHFDQVRVKEARRPARGTADRGSPTGPASYHFGFFGRSCTRTVSTNSIRAPYHAGRGIDSL